MSYAEVVIGSLKRRSVGGRHVLNGHGERESNDWQATPSPHADDRNKRGSGPGSRAQRFVEIPIETRGQQRSSSRSPPVVLNSTGKLAHVPCSFYARPYDVGCGHCKKLKPDWDKLIDEINDEKRLVADVDCTAEGKALCDANGVRGYPTLKYGDPSDLQDYEGGRSLDDLRTFANENLKPMCSVKNIDLCDDEKKAQIQKYQGMSKADLESAVSVEEKKMQDAEEHFKNGKLEGLAESRLSVSASLTS